MTDIFGMKSILLLLYAMQKVLFIWTLLSEISIATQDLQLAAIKRNDNLSIAKENGDPFLLPEKTEKIKIYKENKKSDPKNQRQHYCTEMISYCSKVLDSNDLNTLTPTDSSSTTSSSSDIRTLGQSSTSVSSVSLTPINNVSPSDLPTINPTFSVPPNDIHIVGPVITAFPSDIPTIVPSNTASPSNIPITTRPTTSICYHIPTTEYCEQITTSPFIRPSSPTVPLTISPSVVPESVLSYFQCAPFSVTKTNNAQKNTASCTFAACSGNKFTISNCGGSTCIGDSYIRLYDSNNTILSFDDDGCGNICSTLTYTVPAYPSQCSIYNLIEGCYSSESCSGTFSIVFVTSSPTFGPSTTTPTFNPSTARPTLPCPSFSKALENGTCTCLPGYINVNRNSTRPPCVSEKPFPNPYVNQLSSSAQSALLTAFACFLVNTSYKGPTFQFRRSSDNNVSNFYADKLGNLGTNRNATGTKLSTWLSLDEGLYATAYVVIWYDQSGKGKNAYQQITSLQPKFDQNLLLVDFKSSTAVYLNMNPTSFSLGNSPYTISLKHGALCVPPYSSFCIIFDVGIASSTNQEFGLSINGGSKSYKHNWWISDVLFGTDLTSGNSISLMYDGALRSSYVNGGLAQSDSISSHNTQGENAYLGYSTNDALRSFMNGELYYFVSFNIPLNTSDRNIIEGYRPCPTGSSFLYPNVDNLCRCNINYYSLNGLNPCLSCPVSSSTKAMGSTSCACSTGYISLSGNSTKPPCVSATMNPYVNQLSSSAQSALLTALACFLVNTSYTGPTFQFRRSSDNNVSNFYADKLGNLGTNRNATGTKLSTWLSLDEGLYATAYVVIWYDQSGKGKNAYQQITSLQPKFDQNLLLVDFKSSGSVYMNLNPTSFSMGNNPYTISLKHGVMASCAKSYCSLFHVGAYNTKECIGIQMIPSLASYRNYWCGTNSDFGSSLSAGNSLSIVYDQNQRTNYLNSGFISSLPSYTQNTQPVNAYLGLDPNPLGETNSMNGEFYYFFSFNTALSASDISIVEGYRPCRKGTTYLSPNRDSLCRCDFNYYSSNGFAPCSKCPVGSSTTTVGSLSCTCNNDHSSTSGNGNPPCTKSRINRYVNELTLSAQSALLTVFACYKVNPSYSGPAFQFRRSLDNNITDFYADNLGNLGTSWNATGTNFSAWLSVGGGSYSIAYVVIWYDQSGNGRNAFQNNKFSQPKFDQNLKLVDFKSSNAVYLNMEPTSFSIGNNPYTVSLRHGTMAPCAGSYCVIYQVGGYFTRGLNALLSHSGRYMDWWFDDENDIDFGSSITSGNSISMIYDQAQARRNRYLNDALISSPINSFHNVQQANAFLGLSTTEKYNLNSMNGELFYFYSFNIALSTYDRLVIEGSSLPSAKPTTSVKPSFEPSAIPSSSNPSKKPIIYPSLVPTAPPTDTPSYSPSLVPSFTPSKPTELPSYLPSTFDISFGDGCKICAIGSYCYGNECYICPIGNFCPTGSYAYKCPPDLIAPLRGSKSCYGVPSIGPTPSVGGSILGEVCADGCSHGDGCTASKCLAGYFCVAKLCFACVPGSYCPNGLFSYVCPKNFTSIMGSSECNIISEGSKGVVRIKNSTNHEIPIFELDALRLIYISLNGIFWQVSSSQTLWNFTSQSSLKPCSTKWIGINCSCVYRDDTYRCNIIGINLNGLGLSGTFPASFGSFQFLRNLDIGNNFIYGSISSELNLMKNLQKFDISNNYISGTIPSFDGYANLSFLYIQDNFLQGNLPNFLAQSKLKILNVSLNYFNGSIPTFINLKFLTKFDCSYNKFSGFIPLFQSNNNLKILALQYNQLMGSIPTLSLSNLIYVNLIGNNLVGTIPPNIGSRNITQFIYLGLSTGKNNHFTGSISDNYCSYQNLLSFSMAVTDSKSTCYPSCLYISINADYIAKATRCPGMEDKAICGLIQSIGILKTISGTSNGVTEYYDTPHPLTKSFFLRFDDPTISKYEIKLYGKCSIQISQTIDICRVNGNITACVKLLCRNTTKVVISDSNFIVSYKQSSIDNSYLGFTFSVTKYAKRSALSCVSPPSFSSEKFSSFQLPDGGQIESSYASNLCSWSQVKCLHGQVISLSLRGLDLAGYISESISLLTSLQTLDLGLNSLYGTIPNSIGLLKNLLSIDLSSNKLNGTVPIEITTLPQLAQLILSKNSLTGSIITNISTSIGFVDLSNNLLHGQIPAVLGSFKSTKFNFQGNVMVTCFQPNPNGENVQLVSSLPECSPTNSPTNSPTVYINFPESSTINSALIGSIVGPVGFVLIFIFLYFYRRQRLESQAKRDLEQAKKERLDSLPIHKALIEFYYLRIIGDASNKFSDTSFRNESSFPDKVSQQQDNPLRKSNVWSKTKKNNTWSTYSKSSDIIVIKAIEESISSVNEIDYDGDSAIDICLKNYKISEKVMDDVFIYKILRESILSDIDEYGNLLVAQVSRYGPIWIKVTNSTLILTDVVERILNEFPKYSRNLADTCDHVGRTVLQLAIPEVTKIIIQSINLFRRYDFNRQAHHKSATCSIHLGCDYEDGITGNTKVALKFMSNKEQFLSEINAREIAKFDQQYVVGVMNKFDSDEDDFVRSQLEIFGFSQYPYVLVMSQCNRDLDEIISKELDNSDTDSIRAILSKIARCVSHLHDNGFIHGDLKPKNIMRGNEGGYVLIDLDACAKLPLQYAGSKTSSAYIPPEMIYFNEITNKYDVRVSKNAPDVNLDGYDYEFVLATTAYDSWSLGIILYFLCVGSSLFHSDRSENIINQSAFEELHKFTLIFKKEKLSKVDDLQAKNLISQLLNKDPTKRPTMKQVLMHPFLSMKSTARMIGEKAEFDVFLSYRVASDSHLVDLLYRKLTAAGVKVWLDKYCLEFGKPWDEGFVDGLLKSRIFVPLFSRGAINHPTNKRQNISELTTTSPIDNFLLEQRLALELNKRELIELVSPIMVGDCDDKLKTYNNYFGDGCHPSTKEIVVEEIEKRIVSELDRQSLGLPLFEELGVKSIIDTIFKNQGCFIVGSLDESIEKIVSSIIQAKQDLDEKDNLYIVG